MIPLQVQFLSVYTAQGSGSICSSANKKQNRQTDVLLTTCLSEPSRYRQGVIKQRGQSARMLTPWSAPIQQKRSSLYSWHQ